MKIKYRLLQDEEGNYKAQKLVMISFEDRLASTTYDWVWEDMEDLDLKNCTLTIATARLRAAIRNIPKGWSPVSEFSGDGERV